MAKRIIYESNVVEGVFFDDEEKMRAFDEKIADDDFYIEQAKNLFKDYVDKVEIDGCDFVAEDCTIFVSPNLSETLCDYLRGVYEENFYTSDTIFSCLVDYPSNYYGSHENVNEDVEEKIREYINEKIDYLEATINGLVKFEIDKE